MIEIETKIVGPSATEFIARVNPRANLKFAGRTLKDIAFRLEHSRPADKVLLTPNIFPELDSLFQVLKFLGLETTNGKGQLKVSGSLMPDRRIRIRHDPAAGGFHFTAKTAIRRSAQDHIEERHEHSTPLSRPEKMVRFLETVGYQVRSVIECYRTTWEVPEAIVEANLFPGGVFYAEVEAESRQQVRQAAHRLGYEGYMCSRSKWSILRSAGLNKQQIRNLRFTKD